MARESPDSPYIKRDLFRLISAASSGNADAQLILGRAYWLGTKEITADPEKGEYWLRLVVASGSAKAKFYLAKHLMALRGDHDEAVSILEPLAHNGYLPAQYLLSLVYLNGPSGVQNLLEGERWLKQASDGGHYIARIYHLKRTSIASRSILQKLLFHLFMLTSALAALVASVRFGIESDRLLSR